MLESFEEAGLGFFWATDASGNLTYLSDTALAKLSLSARAHDRVLRVARTIADLAGDDVTGAEHLGEALQFRE